MALNPPLAAPLPKAAKWLIKLKDVAIAGLAGLYDHLTDADVIEDMEWRYLVMRFSRTTPIGTVEDHAQLGLHFVNITSGQIDKSWTAGDYTTLEGHVTEMWQAIRPRIHSSHTLVDYRWYLRAFNPDLPVGGSVDLPDPSTGKPWIRFSRSGPPLRVTAVNQAGSNVTVALPYQASCSVTLRTPAPRHWGRIYLPGMASDQMGANAGRWTGSLLSTVANAFAELLDDGQGSEFQLTIPATQQDGKFAPALNGVTSIQCDDIPDVVRRRRPRQPLSRQIGVPTP